MENICFYHSKDFDGICSGAIVKKFIPDATMVGIDYGDNFSWELVEGKKVYMVDFSLPLDSMIKLKTENELVWIDHHKIAIDNARLSGEFSGVQDYEGGLSACALTWEYFTRDGSLPESVQLLSDYDVWHIENKNVMEFQYGMRSFNVNETRVDNKNFWDDIFDDCSNQFIIDNGLIILGYVESADEKYAKSYAFTGKFAGLPALFVNSGLTSSNFYKSVFDSHVHSICVSFCMTTNRRWSVSLRSFDDSINCGALAAERGGGGHVRAAGFVSKDLDFIQ